MKFLFFLLIAFAPLLSHSQLSQTIRGQVIDRYSEDIIPGAKVYVFSETDSLKQIADMDGYFRFENVPVGRYTVIAAMRSYNEAVLTNLDLTSSKELVLELKLTEKVQSMNAIEVKAQEKGETVNKLSTVSARTFSIEESQRYAGSFNDVARMAQNFAGVQGADDSRNDIIIRGNSPSGVLYRLEGIDIPNPNHFARFGTAGGPVSMLNNNVLSNSDFFTGAFPAEYGNALAGVFDLHMRNGNNERFEFMGQMGFNGAEGMAEGPISRKKKSSFLVNYRYSTLELFKLMGINFGTSAIPKYQDANFKLRFPTKKGVTQIFGLGGLSNIDILSPDLSDPNEIWGYTGNDIHFTSNTGVVGATHKQRINSNSFFKIMAAVQASYNRIKNDTLDDNGENPFTNYRSNSTIGKQTISFLYQNKLSNRHLIKAGIINDLNFLTLSDSLYYESIDAFKQTKDFKGTMFLIRPHVQHRFSISEKITLVSGLYSQVLSLDGQYSIEPRIGANFELKKKQRISIGYGIHSQMAPIEVYFDQITLNEGSTITPNRNVDFTKSQHLIVGYQKRLKYGIQIKTEAYGQFLWKVPIEQTSSSYSILNFGDSFITSTPDTLVNEGLGYNYGFEITLEKFLKNGFYFLITGSIFDSKYQASDKKWRNTAFNGNHTLNVLGGYEFRFKSKKDDPKYKSALTLDLKFVWNGGGRYTEILTAESQLVGAEVRDLPNAYALSFDDYLKANGRIAFKLIGRKTTQEWGVDMQNLTNRDNIFYQQFNNYSGTVETTYHNGFLGIVQYRITF